MPNSFKYSVNAQTEALKRGNFWVGIGDVGKGPTSTTDFWNGIDPPSGGYSVYLNKSSQGPSTYVCGSDASLIALTNRIAGTAYTTVTECLDYYDTQTDKMVWGGEVSPVITNGLTSFIDFSSTACYPRSGTKMWNLANTAVGYVPSTTFSTANGGKITTDGYNNGQTNYVGSRINIDTTAAGVDRFAKENNFTFAFWTKPSQSANRLFSTGSAGSGNTDNCIWQFWLASSLFYWWDSAGGNSNNLQASVTSIPNGEWSYITIAYAYNQGGNNEVKIYRNGSLIGSNSISTAIHSAVSRSGEASLQYTLGGGYYSSCYTLNDPAEFGLFQVYNRTLSADEATTNFNKTKSRFGL